MRDPHVVALHYRLETGPQLAFNNPAPLEKDTDAFALRLTDGHLRVDMKDHFAAVDAACLEVQPYLQSWEIAAALQHGPGALRFEFDRAELEDRDPPPPGASLVITPMPAEVLCLSDIALVRITSAQYPAPPTRFFASPDVVTMWGRYSGYLAGREPLLSMAYLCLTVLEVSTGQNKGRRLAAAAQYNVHIDVLNTLGTMTSERGDATTARKVVAGRPLQSLSEAETRWVKEVITTLIRRVGECAADPTAIWPQITMEDFSRPGSDS